ncbi:MAG: nickel-responsive transcriptional regulator NikR [Betaproteobacteria bacterium]|nr:nickel-responsive transcriptional regulator NikR [Betaproteobacteria bacterium]
MERFTISLDVALAKEFDALIAQRGYRNRSEAVRDILRGHLERSRQSGQESGHCIANLSYVYNHHERELAERLTGLQHAHHDLTVSSLHAHLDHDHCIESVILRGPTAAVRRFAEALMAERGVRHGSLNLVTAVVEDAGARHEAGHGHDHGHDHDHGPGHPWHVHYRPRS